MNGCAGETSEMKRKQEVRNGKRHILLGTQYITTKSKEYHPGWWILNIPLMSKEKQSDDNAPHICSSPQFLHRCYHKYILEPPPCRSEPENCNSFCSQQEECPGDLQCCSAFCGIVCSSNKAPMPTNTFHDNGRLNLLNRNVNCIMNVCSMDMDPGNCYEVQFKFFYNRTAKECQSFVFNGCDGNLNNFNLKIECDVTCNEVYRTVRYEFSDMYDSFGIPVEVLSSELLSQGLRKQLCESGYLGGKTAMCNHPVKKGHCTLSVFRYYFNKMSSLCEPFVFSGCGGNRNNFRSKYLCDFYCVFKQLCACPGTHSIAQAGLELTESSASSDDI
ncbi:hypothetical protein STEG23_035436 [Scotinomys teguina]